MMSLIKSDLDLLGINHDIFFSETTLHNSGKIEEVVETLHSMQLIYEGTLPPPKGKIDDAWQEKMQLLFKSSAYGDDQDRPVRKSDGSWSYLAADFAYAKDKIDRHYDCLVYILGADHSGYIKRIEAVINALSKGKVRSDVRTVQLVNFVDGQEQIKMSKRSGNFMTIHDVIEAVGKDSLRFMMLTRRSDMIIDFDFEKVREQSKDNPVFYVQYAHVRACSIINNAATTIQHAYDQYMCSDYDLSLLESEEEIQLIKLLASWPRILAGAAKYFEPQRIAYYTIDVAYQFHSIWNLGKEDKTYRFNILDNTELTAARLALVEATRLVIANGLEIMGVTPIKKM
jgi:arginyl-tRNA synthetase